MWMRDSPSRARVGLVDHGLQAAAMDRELRKFKAGVGAARLAPDLLAAAVHVEQFVGADADLVEFRQQPQFGQLLDGMRQGIDADAELAHRVGLLENLAVDAACMQHQRRGQAADAAADDDGLHPIRLTLTGFSITWLQFAGNRRQGAW